MNYLAFKATTSGENLFQYILKEIVGVSRAEELTRLNLFKYGGRAEQFSEYFLGAYSFNITARCIKKAKRIRQHIEPERQHTPMLINFFRNQLEMASHEGERNLQKLSILAFEAADNSGKKVSNGVKRRVIGETNYHNCYICGRQIINKSEDPNAILKYEHIWPSTYGGDSIEENLLPACLKCNDKKDDMLLWQDSHIHSFILRPDPSENEWKSIYRREKIAKHRYKIFKTANDRKISLKEAALEVGPFSTDVTALHAIDEEDGIDFFNFDIQD